MINIEELFNAIDSGRKGKNMGLSTGIPKLDDCIGGIQRGIYTLIFAGSGIGKSNLALYSYIYRPLKDNPEKDITLLYFSMEMSEKVLLAKLLSLYVYEEYKIVLSYKDIMSWKEVLSEDNYQYLLKGKRWLESISNKLIIYDKTLNRNTFYKTSLELAEQNGKFIESEDGHRKLYLPNNPDKLILGVIDHIALALPIQGANKKDEMDAISNYAVTLREKCGFSWVFLQQENRNASNMDRRKADMQEPEAQDLKDSGVMYNDANVCIGIYSPLALKVKTHRKYPIIVENSMDSFIGLRDRYRCLFLIKNREGENNKAIPMNFFGEVGLWNQLPPADDITNYNKYLYLDYKETENKKDEVETPTKDIIYKF